MQNYAWIFNKHVYTFLRPLFSMFSWIFKACLFTWSDDALKTLHLFSDAADIKTGSVTGRV